MTDVVTALGHRFEAVVATVLEAVPGVTIARRCADLAELLSVVEAGVGEVAVVGADLRGLDLAAVGRLRARGVRVIGLYSPDDEAGERRLHQLSFTTVLSVEASGPELGSAISELSGSTEPGAGGLDGIAHLADLGGLDDLAEGSSTQDPRQPGASLTDPFTSPVDHEARNSLHAAPGETGWTPAGSSRVAATDPGSPDGQVAGFSTGADTLEPDEQVPERAPVVAIWGPAGAPGRTTVATTLAAELASRGTDVLLVDADTYGGCVAQTLGLLDEAPGIAAACRSADQGNLDVSALARLAPTVTPRLRVLTGLPKAERWPEVRASALERVLELSRALVQVVVVDCGFCLENDEELSYDTAAPRRNEATLTTLAAADVVVAVSGADPIALQRFVRGLQELGSVPSPPPIVVVNRVRSSAVGSKPQVRIAESLLRFAGLQSVRFVPDDAATLDAAVLSGRSIVEHAPDSALRTAVADLASAVAPWTRSGHKAGRRRWRRSVPKSSARTAEV